MEKIKNIFSKIDFDMITTFLLSFIFLSISVTSTLFLIGVSISKIYFPMYIILSALISFIFFYKGKDKSDIKRVIINIVVAILILFITILVSEIFYDNTWDGNTYHKEMIGLMKSGMNPVYNVESGDIWVQHYARAVETFAAVVYSYTNNIESGKALNFLFIILLFGQIYKHLRGMNKGKIVSIMLSIVIAINPISLIQSTCYYVDGIFATTLFFIILMLLKLTSNENKNNKMYLYWLALLTVICINIKFTSLLICTMFIGIFVIYWLYVALKEKTFIATFKKWFVYFVCIYLFGVIVVGASVYIKNFKNYGHPFYPLLGETTSVDIVTDNEPAGLTEYSHLEKFIYTLFSKTYTWYDKKPELKIPFTVYESELDSMQYVDTRVGGFGPLYSGILILSLPVILFYMILDVKRKRRENILLILVFLGIVLPIPILPVVWQLRYYPELYLLPIIALYLLVRYNMNTVKKVCFSVISLALVANTLLFMPAVYGKFKNSIQVNKQLIYLYEQSLYNDLIISIEDCPNAGARYNLQDKNIKYKFLLEKMEDGQPMYYRFYYKIEKGE